MHIFFNSDISDTIIQLNEEESWHCCKVLRLNPGASIILIDGKGGFYEGQLTENNPKKCMVEIISSKQDFGKRSYELHLAIAPTKDIDRFEWFLEKATEIGIDQITPILTQHSERKILKPERLHKIIISAVKQSIKAYVPRLNELCSYKDFIKKQHSETIGIAHCENSLKKTLKEFYVPKTNTIILIGPEGDFSPEEISMAVAKGASEISLGESRLRTETAGIVACHSISFMNL